MMNGDTWRDVVVTFGIVILLAAAGCALWDALKALWRRLR